MAGSSKGKGHIRIRVHFAGNSWGAWAWDLGVIEKDREHLFVLYVIYNIPLRKASVRVRLIRSKTASRVNAVTAVSRIPLWHP